MWHAVTFLSGVFFVAVVAVFPKAYNVICYAWPKLPYFLILKVSAKGIGTS